MVSPGPGWYADPYQRHEYRYWNGQAWSEHVGDHGQAFVDPPGGMTQQAASSPSPQPGGPTPTYAAPWAAPAATAQAAPRRRVTPKLLAGVVVAAIVAGGVGLFVVNSSKPSQAQALTGTAMSATATTLKGADGLQLDIPAGAVPPDRNGKPGTIVVSVDKVAAPSDVDTSNLPSSVKMSGDVFKVAPEGQTFTTPVTLTLPIPHDLQAKNVGGLAYLDVATRKWITVPGEVDAAAGVVRAPITHFSWWTMWQDNRDQMDNWRNTHGGFFDVTNNGSGVGSFPYSFFQLPAPHYTGYTVTYGFCIKAMNFDDPNQAFDSSWYVPGDLLFTVWRDWRQANSGGTQSYWLPNGAYTVDEVWGGSEINPGDPLYVPIYGFASRPLGNLVVTAGSHRAFTESSVQLDAANGWVSGRPECAGVLVPSLGTGDVQVTLNWPQTGVDLDLHVIDPSGNEIYYGNPSSPTGGQLDWDNRNGGGTPENIFWTGGGAPKGTYKVSVVYYGGDKPADWSIRTVVNGKVQTFSGHISESSPTVQVTTFTVG